MRGFLFFVWRVSAVTCGGMCSLTQTTSVFFLESTDDTPNLFRTVKFRDFWRMAHLYLQLKMWCRLSWPTSAAMHKCLLPLIVTMVYIVFSTTTFSTRTFADELSASRPVKTLCLLRCVKEKVELKVSFEIRLHK